MWTEGSSFSYSFGGVYKQRETVFSMFLKVRLVRKGKLNGHKDLWSLVLEAWVRETCRV